MTTDATARQQPITWTEDASAFDVLDESWADADAAAKNGQTEASVKEEGHESLSSQQSVELHPVRSPTMPSSTSSLPSTITRETREGEAINFSKTIATSNDDAWILYGRRGAKHGDLRSPRRRRARPRRRSDEAMTDSELLQPGPSSPSRRMPSHLMESETRKSTSLPPSPSFDKEKHHGISSPTLSSHSSGEKLEGKSSVRLTTTEDDDKDVDQFGSAMESVSTSEAAVTAIEEATFIEYSNVASPPPFMKQAWQRKDKRRMPKDIFGPSPLQALFVPPSPTSNVGVEGAAEEEKEKEVSVREDREAEEEARQRMDETSGSHREEIIHTSSPPQGETENVEQAVSEKADSDLSTSEADNSIEKPLAPTRIPRATFTFSSPMTSAAAASASAAKRPPPTPSASHAPLRLFQLGGRNPEIEHILNTPHSAAKAYDAKRLVWKLVEEEGREEREKKRLRMDRLPPPSALSDADETSEDRAHPTSAFLTRVRAMRASSSGENRTASSLIAKRPGANAPTPERAGLQSRYLHPMMSRRRDSPRKLLRRWSAANQVDEELDQERALDDDDDEEVAADSSAAMDMVRVPSVSVDPPTKVSADTLALPPSNLANSMTRSIEHPGMLHIAAGTIPERDIEALSNGKMTFDREKGRWIRIRHLQQQHGAGESAADESSDPFRDLDSNASPSNVTTTTTTRRENEKLLSVSRLQASPMPTRLAPPSTSWSPNGGEFLTPAKSNASFVNRSTPRSILKTAGSVRGAAARWPTTDEATPTLARQASRKISFADGPKQPSGGAATLRRRFDDLMHQFSLLVVDPLEALEEEQKEKEHVDTSFGRASRSFATTESELVTPRASTSRHSMPARSPWGLSMLKSGTRKREGGDMGNASFLTNASFNVAHDRVLELLTDVAPWTTRWHDMRSIDLRGRRVESLVRIDEFLPQLEEALLDDNEISYLTGLPSSLRRLSIARNRLAPTAAFGHLSNLEFLDVSSNRIDVKALRNLVRLRHLLVNDNKLTSLDGLQNVSTLEKLHVRNNRLSTLMLVEGQWPKLQDFVLAHNKLVQIDGVSVLSNLRSLNLDHNQLATFALDTPMPRLKLLRVSGNADLCLLDVGYANNLRTLYADECALSEVKNIGVLKKLDNLSLRQQTGIRSLHWPAHQIRDVKRLFLSGNAFRAIDLSTPMSASRLHSSIGMTQFFGLIYLELSGCQLTSLPNELGDMVPNVRHLNADYNLFERLPALHSLRRLKRLSLVGCRIRKSRTLVESVYGCEELIFLDVRMNPCTLGLYPPIVLAAPSDAKALNRAFLPPIPHPLFAGPSAAALSSSQQKKKGNDDLNGNGNNLNDDNGDDDDDDDDIGGKSFFHKRTPPPLMSSVGSTVHDGGEAAATAAAKDEDPISSTFAASDIRFVRTLPAHFRLQRLLHRGSLAMACVNLTWLDGLLVDEEEVRQADKHLRRHAATGAHDNGKGAARSSSSSERDVVSSDDM